MNTRRMNRLEELGRVDAEKADTRKGKRNLREEKSRIVRELKAKGGKAGGKRKPSQKQQDKLGGMRKSSEKRPSSKKFYREFAEGGRARRRKMGPDARDKAKGKKGGRKSFPDLTGDGKVTRADVLKGRGVFKSGGIAKRGRGCEIR